MKKSAWYIGGATALLIVIVAIVALSGGSEPALAGTAETYKSPTCSCCGIWTQYAKGEGLDLAVHEVADTSGIKEQYEVPRSLWSCHTTIVDGYFVEGHVPAEAIEKLQRERPDIAGIALPGMPSGTPGMPGAKQGAWVIYAVGHDGSISEFMII